MKVGSLFSGIGGFDLGFERTGGFRTAWFCEKEEFCQRVLAKHWPGIPCYPDVEVLTASEVEGIDVLTGGFPCQDLSYAGRGAGITGARSGLWSHYARLISELEPRYVAIENVPALRARGLEVVLADLTSLGYDAEWDHIPASAVGAPHRRDRIWIIAYPRHRHEPERPRTPRRQGGQRETERQEPRRDGETRYLADTDGLRAHRAGPRDQRREEPTDSRIGEISNWWSAEPDVGRVAHGIPTRVDRLTTLGNALVPQIAEQIGYRILEYEGAQ